MADAGHPELVLASASITRQNLLKSTGLAFRIEPATVDEHAIRAKLRQQPGAHAPAHVAEQLARAKARQVSAASGELLVIGADQVLALGDEIFAKPRNIDEARDALLRLRGRTHHLHTTVALARAGDVLWSHGETAALTMRSFSDVFLADYLARRGMTVCSSPGGYEIEGLGIQLFERIEGDYFGILGLPLVPLLAELRARGYLVA
jgi:septum formation protein